MVSVALNPGNQTVNLNPYSTFIVNLAEQLPGGITPVNLGTAKNTVMRELNFGLDGAMVNDPINTTITKDNVAHIVKGSEALSELIVRTHATLLAGGFTPSEDQLIKALAGDLTDGVIDGRGINADARYAATTHLVGAQILIETLTNSLRVGGAEVTTLLDSAIQIIEPDATNTTADVLISTLLLDQARKGIAAQQSLMPSQALITIAGILEHIPGNSKPEVIETLLPGETRTDFDPAISAIMAATDSQLTTVNTSARNDNQPAEDAIVPVEPAPPEAVPEQPTISFSANPVTVAYDETTTLSWSSTEAGSCTASGAWSGTKNTSGSFTTGSLTGDINFKLTCTGPGGEASDTVLVSVSDPAAKNPVLSFSASPSSIDYNGTSLLSWFSTNTNTCVASGAWFGDKATSGSATIGPISDDMTYNHQLFRPRWAGQ
jgi:hypothetical protein